MPGNPLPLPRGQTPTDLQIWGTALVDQLRRQSSELLQTAESDTTRLDELRAIIDDINRRLTELVALLGDLDGRSLSDQLAFILELQGTVEELFKAARADRDAALAAAQRTAISAISAGVLGLGNTALIRVEQQTRLEAGYAFANQIESLVARIGTAEAAIVTEMTVRSDGDESFAQRVESLFARVGQTETAIDTERTVRTTSTTSLAELLTTLRSAIGGQEISITDLRQTVDGHSARATTSINSNGQIIGLIDLSGTPLGSQFTVVADRFLIASPTDSAEVRDLFTIISRVGERTRFGINGDMYLTGTIGAHALNVASLDAITANLGTITAGVMRSTDGQFVIDLSNKSIVIDF